MRPIPLASWTRAIGPVIKALFDLPVPRLRQIVSYAYYWFHRIRIGAGDRGTYE